MLHFATRRPVPCRRPALVVSQRAGRGPKDQTRVCQRFASASTRPRARRGRGSIPSQSCFVCAPAAAASVAGTAPPAGQRGPAAAAYARSPAQSRKGGASAAVKRRGSVREVWGNRGARGSTERTVADSDRSRAAFMVRETLTKVPRSSNFVCEHAHVATTPPWPPCHGVASSCREPASLVRRPPTKHALASQQVPRRRPGVRRAHPVAHIRLWVPSQRHVCAQLLQPAGALVMHHGEA